jgi:hypothetical protein
MLEVLTALLLIVCGILAASSLIVAKQPDARRFIDKLVPFDGILGVSLLVCSVLYLLTSFSLLRAIRYMSGLFALTVYVSLATSFVLGFLLGMPLIAKWMPGKSSAQQQAMQMQKRLASYQTVVGVVAIVAGLMLLLFHFRILRPV